MIGVVLLFISCTLFAESKEHNYAMNYKLWGLSSHIGKDVFLHLGAEVDYDYYVTNSVILRVATSVYEDSSRLLAGFFHLGPRFQAQKFNKIFFRVGVGPTLYWRKNWWKHVSSYKGSALFGKTYHDSTFETAFFWWCGDIEMEWKFSEKKRLVFTVVPGIPIVVNTNIGLRMVY